MVDDLPEKLLTYETILAPLDEHLIRATSGKEALDMMLKTDIAVLLVDVCMPEVDGFELVTMVRSHPRFQQTAVILVSSVMVEDDDRLKGYDYGAVDYVPVPIQPGILRAKVAIFVDLYRKSKALEESNRQLEERVHERTAEIEQSAELLRHSEQRFRLLVENIYDYSILMLDREGRISSWNSGTERLYGYSEAEVLGQDSTRFFSAEDRQSGKPARLLEIAAREGHSQDEGWRLRKDGSRFWASITLTALYDGELLGFSQIVHDLTDRKRADEERSQLLQTAEEARQEAEAANQMKDEFLAVLSHELRTPLNAITGWAHMLQAGDLDAATQAKAVETINRNAMLQARLISDLLDVSRIVSGKLRLDLKPVELQGVIRAAIDTVRPAAEAKEVQIDVDTTAGSGPVRGDAFRLQQVVWNLLSNAVKFSPRKCHIQVRLERHNSRVELTVADEGPGIRPDFLPHIFEAFRQADATTTRPHQGLGLGLAIVRNLLQLHGGSVKAMNRTEGSGAIFKVTLPLDISQPLGVGERQHMLLARDLEGDEVQLGTILKGIKVVIVDDEADAREVGALILDRCGATVRAASSAGEAFEMIQRETPDVLVADIEMPGEDGYSLVRRVRRLPPDQGGQMVVIALTAHASANDIPKLVSAGFQRYVPKPLQPRELISAIVALTKAEHSHEAVHQRLPARKPGPQAETPDIGARPPSAPSDWRSRN